jgi:hypothetical protein
VLSSHAASPSPRIKGAAIQAFLRWYATTWGNERLVQSAREIPEEHLGQFDLEAELLGVLTSSWYPALAIHALLDAIERRHPHEERALIVRDGARAIIDSTLRGVYRWLFEKMMNPERYARSAQQLFSRYYEPGTMLKVPLGTTGHLTIVRGWTGHHPMLCDFLLHTAEYVYSAMGCRDVKVRRTACVMTGSNECRFEATWV